MPQVCLESDPGQRYASAAALAEDLERWARGEAILARPMGGFEATRAWARRRPELAAMAGSLCLVFLLGVSGIAWAWLQASRNARHAQAAADRAEAVQSFLLEDLLLQSSPEQNAVETNIGLRAVLDIAAAKVDSRFSNQVEVCAAIQHLIGCVYLNLGAQPEAERHLQRACDLRSAFDMTLADGNLLTGSSGTTRAVTDGVYLLLAPLPPGRHTIEFYGYIDNKVQKEGFDFNSILDISYTITVQ